MSGPSDELHQAPPERLADLLAEAVSNPEPTAAEPPHPERPGAQIGAYKLLERIGEGGYGVVYLAEQSVPIHRRVALKVIKLGMDTRQVVARFEAERQALALMDHPNIAKVLDAGATDSGRPFFVMEWVKGVRITDYCDQHQLSTADRLRLVIPICHALQHAHQKGIIHRDLKPSNLLVTLQDGVPTPKVIDFGIAKATAQPLTEKTLFTGSTQILGTPAYMSPEQAAMGGTDLDTRSDIYSLGVLLYELLTGRLPFEADELMRAGLEEMRRLIREQEPPRPSTRLSTLSGKDLLDVAQRRQAAPPKLLSLIRGDLDWVVMKCLEKERERRYESASALARDLERHLHHEPVAARPPGAIYLLRKSIRRNRLAYAAGTTVASLLVAGTFLSTWQARTANRARTEAEQARTAAQQAQREAEARAQEARKALAHSDFLQAINLVAADRAGDAVAYLVRCLRLDPSHDAAATRLANLLAYRSWCVPVSEPMNHVGGVLSLQFSPDGKWLVTASDDGTGRVWDAATGKPVTLPLSHGKKVSFAQFSPDGSQVLTTSIAGTAQVWESQTGQALFAPLRPSADQAAVFCAAFSPDGSQVVTGSVDGTVQLWDAQTGQALSGTTGTSDGVVRVQFTPDAKFVLTVTRGGWVRVWDARSGLAAAGSCEHPGVFVAQASPNGQWLVTGSDDGTARLWDLPSGRSRSEPLRHAADVTCVQFSPDGRWVATGSMDRTARAWDVLTGQPIAGPFQHDLVVTAVSFSPDGKRILTASADATARIWELQTGQTSSEALKHRDYLLFNCAQFSPDGKRVATGSWDKTARLWEARMGGAMAERDIETPKAETTPPAPAFLPEPTKVESVYYSADRKRVVALTEEGEARVWDVPTERPITGPLRHGLQVRTAAFSPDGSQVATGSYGGSAMVWSVQTGRPITHPLPHAAPVNAVQFSANGKWLDSWTADLKARVWDVRTGQPLTDQLPHFREDLGPVRVQFHADGKQVVTVVGGKACLWDIAPTTGPAPAWLLSLAEAFCGRTLNAEGVVVEPDPEPFKLLAEVRATLTQASGTDDWVVWGRWLLADRSTRTISPFSGLTVPQWIAARIGEAQTNLTEATYRSLESPFAKVATAALHHAVQVAAGAGHASLLAQAVTLLAVQTGDVRFAKGEFVAAERAYAEAWENAARAANSATFDRLGVVGSRTATLMALGRNTEADQLLQEEVFTPGSPPGQVAASLQQKGGVLARRGHRGMAIAVLGKAIDLQPEDHWNWYWLATLLAESPDLPRYRHHCQAMLARFGATTNASIAERMAKTSLLVPDPGPTLEQARQLAERAVTVGARDTWLPYYLFAAALAAYRQGHFAKAVEITKVVLTSVGEMDERGVQALSVLALALQQLQQPAEARAALDRANAIARDSEKLPGRQAPDLGASWHDVLIAHQLLQEAKEVVGAAAASNAEPR